MVVKLSVRGEWARGGLFSSQKTNDKATHVLKLSSLENTMNHESTPQLNWRNSRMSIPTSEEYQFLRQTSMFNINLNRLSTVALYLI